MRLVYDVNLSLCLLGNLYWYISKVICANRFSAERQCRRATGHTEWASGHCGDWAQLTLKELGYVLKTRLKLSVINFTDDNEVGLWIRLKVTLVHMQWAMSLSNGNWWSFLEWNWWSVCEQDWWNLFKRNWWSFLEWNWWSWCRWNFGNLFHTKLIKSDVESECSEETCEIFFIRNW